MNGLELLRVVLQDAFWSGVAATGFAILFNVPPKTLLSCVLCGAFGHAARTLLMQYGTNIAPATLAGAALVGVLSVLFARRQHAPALIYAICGAIPMVPGSFAYQTMMGVIRVSTANAETGMPVLVQTGSDFVNTGLILAAIALGIALPSLLFRRRKPVA